MVAIVLLRANMVNCTWGGRGGYGVWEGGIEDLGRVVVMRIEVAECRR